VLTGLIALLEYIFLKINVQHLFFALPLACSITFSSGSGVLVGGTTVSTLLDYISLLVLINGG